MVICSSNPCLAPLRSLNVKQEEIDEMLKEALEFEFHSDFHHVWRETHK